MTRLIDPRSYNSLGLYARQKKSPQFLKGYQDGFDGLRTRLDDEDYVAGHAIGKADKLKEQRDPWIRGGRPASNWYQGKKGPVD